MTKPLHNEKFVGTMPQHYQTVVDALSDCVNGDIITITDGRTYQESLTDITLNNITIKSSRTSPDDFPVLKLNINSNTLNHIDGWLFEAVIMEPNVSRFTQNLKNVTFRRVIFRNYDYFMACDCQPSSVKKFESCIFHDFSQHVFNAQQNYGTNALVIKNCTFHNCASIFGNDFYNDIDAGMPVINNCVFTSCPNFAPNVQDGTVPPFQRLPALLGQIKYGTFTNDPQTASARLGQNCYVNINENQIYTYNSGVRTLPTHFKIDNDATVRDVGSNALGYSPDVANIQRSETYDRGAWEYDGSEPPPPSKKMILPYVNYQAAF